MFYGWTELPSSEQIKKFYDKKASDPYIDESTAKNFMKLGYSSEQIKKMKDQLAKAGYSQS